MRRQFIVVALALLLVGGFALSADEAVLIDFSLLKTDVKLADESMSGKTRPENKATLMDFSGMAGKHYTEEQKNQMRVSMAIPNWDVTLSSSARTNLNQALSMTAEATVNQDAKLYAGKTVMGLRVRFPSEAFNAWARIKPPFEVPAFEPQVDVDDEGKITPKTDQQGQTPGNAKLTRFEGSKDDSGLQTALGIVKNVGTIKSVSVMVRGLNFPHGLSVILRDGDGAEKSIFMGYLNFDGWKELRWDNPQYVTEVRNRELKINPLYPKAIPFVKFDGFQVTRDAAHVGGDFIAYFKEVRIVYDKAVLEPTRDIDDESIWGIVTQKEKERMEMESKQFGYDAVLRYIERASQHKDAPAATPAP